jgi:hypothetical protein
MYKLYVFEDKNDDGTTIVTGKLKSDSVNITTRSVACKTDSELKEAKDKIHHALNMLVEMYNLGQQEDVTITFRA